MRGPRFEVYETNDGRFDWRLKAGNAEVVATSHRQGFRDRTDAERSIRSAVYAVLAMVENAEEGETDPFGVVIVHLGAGELGFTGGEESDSGDEGSENGEAQAERGEADELGDRDEGDRAKAATESVDDSGDLDDLG